MTFNICMIAKALKHCVHKGTQPIEKTSVENQDITFCLSLGIRDFSLGHGNVQYPV